MRRYRKSVVTLLIGVLAPVALYAADKVISVNCNDIGRGVELIGSFGVPLGRYITIEGKPATEGKVGVRTLRVVKVDGKALPEPVDIYLENVGSLPAGTTFVLKGYETGGMDGTPPDVVQKTDVIPTQQVWGFHVKFVVHQVVIPDMWGKK